MRGVRDLDPADAGIAPRHLLGSFAGQDVREGASNDERRALQAAHRRPEVKARAGVVPHPLAAFDVPLPNDAAVRPGLEGAAQPLFERWIWNERALLAPEGLRFRPSIDPAG